MRMKDRRETKYDSSGSIFRMVKLKIHEVSFGPHKEFLSGRSETSIAEIGELH